MSVVFDFGPAATPKENCVTAAYIYEEPPTKDTVLALDNLESSEKWALLRLEIDQAIANAFRVVKVPTLVMYNSSNEETARVYGTQNIVDLITKILE